MMNHDKPMDLGLFFPNFSDKPMSLNCYTLQPCHVMLQNLGTRVPLIHRTTDPWKTWRLDNGPGDELHITPISGTYGRCIYPMTDPWCCYILVTWIPFIYPSHVSIYTSTMDPMGITHGLINQHTDQARTTSCRLFWEVPIFRTTQDTQVTRRRALSDCPKHKKGNERTEK